MSDTIMMFKNINENEIYSFTRQLTQFDLQRVNLFVKKYFSS